MSIKDAMKVASDNDLDLVQVAEREIPVCKIMDFSNFMYQKKQIEKKNKKSRKQVVLKTIRFGVNCGENDLNIKLNKARGFLEQKNMLKLVLQFKGREIVYKEIGRKKCDQCVEELSDIAKLDQVFKMRGMQMHATFFPKKNN